MKHLSSRPRWRDRSPKAKPFVGYGASAPDKLTLVFQGLQAVAAVATFLLASWAIFFSTLPEVLERQLRVEISDAKEEAISIRRANDNLLQDQAALKQQYSDAALDLDELSTQITALEQSREEVTNDLEVLTAEREKYAREARTREFSILSEVIKYEVNKSIAIASICEKYGDHRTWLNAQREIDRLNEVLDSQPFEQRYAADNPLALQVDDLRKIEFPSFWWSVPRPPVLAPMQSDSLIVLDENDVALLNAMGDSEATHRQVIEYLFSLTMKDRGARLATGRSLIDQIKSDKSLAPINPGDRALIADIFDGFLVKYPEYENMPLSIAFLAEPSAGEIIAAGVGMRPKLAKLSEQLYAYLQDMSTKI